MYLPNKFNNKIFEYFKCLACESIFIHPLPTEEDLTLMYSGTNDHTYLEDVDYFEHNNKFDKYHYRWHQLRDFNQNKGLLKGKKFLDAGCGNGFYLKNAVEQGFKGTGIEFDKKFTEILRQKTKLNVYTIDEVEQTGEKFDVIHIGHMLEHLTDPVAYMNRIFGLGHEKTYYIIDGPVESNCCLSRIVVDFFAKRNYKNKTKKYNQYDPQHLTFTNYNSQLLFFKNLGLKTVKYEINEQPWPLNNKIKSMHPKSILTGIVSKLSIAVSNAFKKQGNVFHYIGQPK
jgi:SAM-dependent methyltransferase